MLPTHKELVAWEQVRMCKQECLLEAKSCAAPWVQMWGTLFLFSRNSQSSGRDSHGLEGYIVFP